MSRAKTGVKVLRTALKRVEKGWIKGDWHQRRINRDTGEVEHLVCLEGAIFGFCKIGAEADWTKGQREAIGAVQDILAERYSDRCKTHVKKVSIPSFNDNPETTKEEVAEVIKLAIIRLETGDDEATPEEMDDLVEFLAKS